jgi:poly(3-hydroxybutyrate) depolymerase
MHQRMMVCLSVLLLSLMINAQTTVNVRGKVTNLAGKGIANATVTLVRQGLKATTGADGAYTITGNVGVLPAILPQTEQISVENGILAFTLSYPSPVKIEFFDVKGNLLKKELLRNVQAGEYRLNMAKNMLATNLLVIKASIGKSVITFRYMPLHNGKISITPSSGYTGPAAAYGLAKMAAVIDTIKAAATNYKTKSMTITSYDQELNITLDSAVAGSTGSIGCGKTLGAINKTGTYTIQSSGSNRTYIIKFPSNYDKTKPYRLIFAMHCMGCDAATMAGTNSRSDGAYNYYRLGSLATDAILVAPQGNSDGTWGGDKDHKFFDDMLKLFKDTLCIDTARVFSCGFSFGAMFTYSLSTNHQKQLRAVACYAPANYNIWLPTNTHEPIAYMQTTGMSDGTCPWDQGGRGGKYCAIGHAQDNSCDNPTTISTSSGQYKVHDFQGCDEGYPVKIVTFGGGHTAGESWMPQMTWDFFKQF